MYCGKPFQFLASYKYLRSINLWSRITAAIDLSKAQKTEQTLVLSDSTPLTVQSATPPASGGSQDARSAQCEAVTSHVSLPHGTA